MRWFSKFLLPFLFLCKFAIAQNGIKTYIDKNGNEVTEKQVFVNNKLVYETHVIPKFIPKPINPDTLVKDSIWILVDKSDYKLQVFYKKKLIRKYLAVFGPDRMQDKCKRGDRCTPEGWFTIVEKHESHLYNKFIGIDYPNDSTYMKRAELIKKGKIKETDQPGDHVGIHGIWKKGNNLIEKKVGWTDGCIALRNEDIDELYQFINKGIRIYIRK
jgi:murein L,D-transpeptidase YafK